MAAYGNGATSMLSLIPLCGSIAGGLYAIVVMIIGLAKAHEISTGQGRGGGVAAGRRLLRAARLFYGALAALLLGGDHGGRAAE